MTTGTTGTARLGGRHTHRCRLGQPSRQPISRFPRPGALARPAAPIPVPEVSQVSDLVRGKEITIMTAKARPVPGGATVTDLVIRAREGDQQAWDAIVERYAPLVWSISRRYWLARPDAGDAGQAVWLQLVDHIGQIRDPVALPGWLATTTGRECARLVRAARKASPAAMCSTPRTSPTARPSWPTTRCSPPNGTRRCQRLALG